MGKYNIQALSLQTKIRGQLFVNILVNLAITACYIIQSILLAWIVAQLFIQKKTDISIPLIMLIAVVILRSFFLWIAEIASQKTAQATKQELRKKLLTRLFELGPSITLRKETGDIQTIIINGVEALESYYSRYIPAIIGAFLGSGGVLIILAVVDWPSAILLSIFVIAFPVIDRLWMRWQMPEISGVFAAMGNFGNYMLDSLQGIIILKAFGVSGQRRKRLAERTENLKHVSMETIKVTLMRTGLTSLITFSGIALVIVVNSYRVTVGDITPLALLIFLFLAREAFRPLDRLEKEFSITWAANGAIPPMVEFLNMDILVNNPTQPVTLPQHYPIEFKHVNFTYPNSDKPALNELCFTIKEYETVALVGVSGSGKTTITNLLQRFFDVDNGEILIGDINIRNMLLDDLHSLISVVSQDIFLFHGTIAENLRLAKPDASEQELHHVATAACINGFIEKLPQGYETMVGERGANLSGGQRQRIAIARALLKNSPILILDEATSNLDPENEKAIQESLDTLTQGRTTLIIAHRLSTIQHVNQILVFENGKLVEQGSPSELAQHSAIYARLLSLESQIL
ncbi:ABC-type transport system involved in cytochrome bd biosynthesis [Commensalibacter communis]|uniref:ABC transporter ATP-binding protein n=1 Tax=Commensalibacter communis TaxID=2972786 RepID=UPI0022FF7954|nr:ABC transporter ATP-binding protein [Commensalibacter communis]CAI3958738.1 ABC-type transport system involved in cytochrome bd biosynthesis [Commensalibacter communis]